MTERAEHTAFTPGPWEYVPGTEHHGPYVAASYGDVCDCYAMSNPLAASIRNGGTSYPINHQGANAEANARLIAAAPDLLAACQDFVRKVECGEAKSTRSYEQMKAAISKATGEA